MDLASESIRKTVDTLVRELSGILNQQFECGGMFTLLTEQLIRYLPSDTFFALHWDKDRLDKREVKVDAKSFDGPGDLLVSLSLNISARLMMAVSFLYFVFEILIHSGTRRGTVFRQTSSSE